MNSKIKNAFIYFIVKDYLKTFYYLTNLQAEELMKKDFFELTSGQIAALDNLSQVISVKPRYGCSKARTLWYRAQEGKPF